MNSTPISTPGVNKTINREPDSSIFEGQTKPPDSLTAVSMFKSAILVSVMLLELFLEEDHDTVFQDK